MDKDQFDGLLAFKTVAEKRSFTAAATELGISPPALSQTIKLLESRLGVALLARTTRTTRLTEAGETFLRAAAPAMDQLLGALHDVSATSLKPTGTLRLNTLRYAYPWLVAPLVKSFRKAYPDVSVEVCLEDTVSDIVAQGFDAGIRLSEILAEDRVAVKLLGPVRFVVAGSPRYFKSHPRPARPQDLLRCDCIRTRVGDELYDHWEFERGGKGFEVKVSGTYIVNDPLLASDAAAEGLGLVYAAEDSIRGQLESGKLERVLEDYVATSAGYYLYYPKRSQVQPKLRAFIEHAKEASRALTSRSRRAT